MKSNQSWQTTKNDNNEIDVKIDKNLILSNELEKIRLRLENKLRLFFNEWFIHENEGLNWLRNTENVGQIGNMLQKFNIESQIRETILSDEAVSEIIEFESNFLNFKGTYNFKTKILLKNGDLIVL